MAECQPPAGQKQANQIANKAQRPGTEILMAGDPVPGDGDAPKWQKRVLRGIEGRASPRYADDRDGHDHPGDDPADRQPKSPGEDPQNIENHADWRHRTNSRFTFQTLPYVGEEIGSV